MIRQNYKKHLFYTVLAAILAIGLTEVSETIVRSQRLDDTARRTSKPGAASEEDVPNMISAALTSPGGLDPTFSGDGRLTDWLSRGDDSARGVAMQPDGKIVVAGTSFGDFAVARYNTDGSLDSSFGANGKVTTDINSSYDYANAVAIQQDGKIVVAGQSGGGPYPDFAVIRYNSDGSLDASFGSNGKVTTDIDSGAEEAYSLAIYPDGKIVVAGRRATYDSGGTNDFAVVRYNTNGSLDTTFDSDGKVTTDMPSPYDIACSVAIQADGKIVAAGHSWRQVIPQTNFTLVRYNVDGSLDSSFDGDGKVTTFVGSASSRAYSVAIQPDGRIVAAGSAVSGFGLVRYTSNGSVESVSTIPVSNSNGADSVAIQSDGKIVAAGLSNSSFVVVRLNSNFSIDAAFGTNGSVTTPIGSEAWARQLAVQPDGKIVAAGYSRSIDSVDFALARYNANGSLDTSFDGDGKVTTDFGFFQGNALYDTAIQADGKIVAAGGVRGDFALLRYNPDGSPDAAFGSGTGKVRTGLRSYDGARAVAIQPDGKIVVAGGSNDGDDNECCFALARYNVDGSLDPTFGSGGRVSTGAYGNYSGAYDVAIQPDGKIVAVGYDGGFAVYRFNSDGSLDASFGGDGTVTTAIGSSSVATDVIIQPDGRIVAAGSSGDYYSSDFTVVRYNGNGSLDSSFGAGGIVATPTSTQDQASSAVRQPDGKIIVAGSRSDTGFALIRYNGNGSLDPTFGTGGVVTTQVGLRSAAHAVALQPNGKIVASGAGIGIGNSGDFAVVRYNANGSLDSTFGGGDGITTADFDNSTDDAYGLALDNAGRAVVVGASDGSFALARFRLDPAFTPFDYDGDGRADISVFRPASGDWYLNRSTNGLVGLKWGLSTDKIAPADYDGDAKTDVAVYRPSEGRWYIFNSATSTFSSATWGVATDIPTPGDFDSDGRADVAIFRPSDGNWWLNRTTAGTIVHQFGVNGDHPVVGDYDGDGTADIAAFRPSTGVWYIFRSAAGVIGYQFGVGTDKVTPADFDGDGRTDIAVYRPSEGKWYIANSGSPTYPTHQFGIATDIPTPADYDGDGRADIAIFRPSDGNWWINRTTAGLIVQQFGQNGDKPTPNAFGN